MSKVYFRGSREEAKRIIRGLGPVLAGSSPDTLGIARGIGLAVGVAALSDVKADFVRKARGGVGEDGETWPPLSKEYLAYQRRFGAGEKSRLKKHAGLGPANRFAPGRNKGLLTAAQLKRWKQIYSRVLRRLSASISAIPWSLAEGAENANTALFASGGMSGAKSRAAAIAWATLKREGAKTMLEVFGSRKVEILRDTGILFNSLSPGTLDGGALPTGYTKPSADGGEQQILDAVAGSVIVGTNVPYAATHNHGDAKRGIPKRQFLPSVIPQTWLDRWANVAHLALAAGIRLALGAGR